MGWVRISKWNKYNAHMEQTQAETQIIIPSSFANGVPFSNPTLISSTSNLYYVREGLLDNIVTKESNDRFRCTKFVTDIGFETLSGIPLFYITHSSGTGTHLQSKVNITVQRDSQVVLLKFYIVQSMGVLHVRHDNPNNKPPIELGFKCYNNAGTTYFNLASRGQWDGFDTSPYYDKRLAAYGEEIVQELRIKTIDLKNMNTFDNQVITLESYPVAMPSGNYALVDNFVSWITCRLDIFRKGQHILPDLNHYFLYENK